jgi:enhancing lycopene biosynthesis protein 2
MEMLTNSRSISEVDPDAYDVIFMAGGWGAAYDLAQSAELAEVITMPMPTARSSGRSAMARSGW